MRFRFIQGHLGILIQAIKTSKKHEWQYLVDRPGSQELNIQLAQQIIKSRISLYILCRWAFVMFPDSGVITPIILAVH